MRLVLTWAVAWAMATGVWAGEAKFTAGPTATKDGDKTKIAFTVSAPTDVEIAVLGADGKVVRHLAAGLLGGNAPAPLKKDSLAQEVLWDRRDDQGKPAAGGPFKARVRIGSTVRLDKYLGWDGSVMGVMTVGLTIGRDGEVYVMESEGNWGRTTLRVLDRSGKYARTIIPYPANTPRERTRSVGHLEIAGDRLPIVFSGHGANVYPLTEGMMAQSMAVNPKGGLLMTSAVGTMCSHRPPRHLLALHPEGGAPEDMPFVGPRIRDAQGFGGGAGERGVGAFDGLACSPDGKHIYLTQAIYSRVFKQRHGVFRLEWSDKGLGAPFLGKDEPGADDGHFNNPQGVATDKAGNIYVCDRGNNRVMVFSSEGKLLRKFTVEEPEQIGVHLPTDDVFVLSRKTPPPKTKAPLPKLLRFSAPDKGEPRSLASVDADIRLMALDPNASPARLWVAMPGGWRQPDRLASIEDKGGKLEVGQAVSSREGLAWPLFIAADPAGKRVLVRERWEGYVAIDPESGRITSRKVPGTGDETVFDRQGNLHSFGGYGSNKVARFDPAGKPLPFPGTGSNDLKVPHYARGPSVGVRGACVGLDGSVYACSNGPGDQRLMAYAPDGSLKSEALIDGLGPGDCSVGADAAGNVYFGINRKLEKHPLPEPFAGKVPAVGWGWWKTEREPPWCYPYVNPYLYHMGAVFKFGPGGGKLGKGLPDATEFSHGYLGVPDSVQGSLWHYPGFGVVAASAGKGKPSGDPGCVCINSRFAVDPFGRVFMPNPFLFAVEVLDTNGNRLLRVGRYGNADSAGPGSKVPQPEIAFGSPFAVSVRGDSMYVSDSVNQRVAAVKFEAAASAECVLP